MAKRKAARKAKGGRAGYMVNVWLGKELGPALEAAAKHEAEVSGRRTTRIQLGRELLAWAFDIYRTVWSLAKLKAFHPVSISPRYPSETQKKAFQDLQTVFEQSNEQSVEQVVNAIRSLGGKKRKGT